jgi:hypothetical protein
MRVSMQAHSQLTKPPQAGEADIVTTCIPTSSLRSSPCPPTLHLGWSKSRPRSRRKRPAPHSPSEEERRSRDASRGDLVSRNPTVVALPSKLPVREQAFLHVPTDAWSWAESRARLPARAFAGVDSPAWLTNRAQPQRQRLTRRAEPSDLRQAGQPGATSTSVAAARGQGEPRAYADRAPSLVRRNRRRAAKGTTREPAEPPARGSRAALADGRSHFVSAPGLWGDHNLAGASCGPSTTAQSRPCGSARRSRCHSWCGRGPARCRIARDFRTPRANRASA